ncbi:carbamoyltransferase family protein [Zeaxanthinibacter enoshimensis]|uniref:Carbamoyltransferase n=1 Tax=Zeaxanthinibacter enoshimensis TaxID=392009 RepID=A0A4R6TJT7_9FLAO|nr:carbamoyltransferase C-terminal domain-containing protein [Zeaxanthinibacter enoshimensis]TDQ31154.1 carbamoyltransferase [Zeaxanthinibacter enoshimensis]
MIILGLNYYFHDSTACIIRDGKLIAAIEEERLSRVKHTGAFPEKAINRCLEMAGITFHDIDHIAVSIKPTTHWFKKSMYVLKNLRSFMPFFGHHVVNAYAKQRRFKIWYNNNFTAGKKPEVHFIEHHLTHVAGTFFVSPYEKAALLGIDGSGEWATTWLGYGEKNKVENYTQSFFPNSFGSFYETVTQFCGFIPNYDEGKTMGLAPMGDPTVFEEEVSKMIWVDGNGQVKVDLSYFNFQHLVKKTYSEKFIKIFGEPRHPKGEFKKHHLDVAAAFQKVLEERVLELCHLLHKRTQADYLVISGGVSLNSVMNGRIVRETPFKDVYVMPAAGDNGTALGAAYYLYNGILNNPRNFVHNNPYIGTEYSDKEIEKAIGGAKLKARKVENIAREAAKMLAEGKIIGWFQGRMEIGPRALGSRSILANPAFPQMKDKINSEVKFREAYRPFAPSALKESYKDYFDLEVEAPFMLKVCQVKEDKKEIIPAVTHVDGSARLQTVDRNIHPLYHSVIRELGEITGVPVILNTSFNIQGEPVVESPKDALRCFYSTGLDALAIGSYILEKDMSSPKKDQTDQKFRKEETSTIER